MDGDDIQLFTRTDKNWSHKLTALIDELMELQLPSGWYDGEIVVPNQQTGLPDFGA